MNNGQKCKRKIGHIIYPLKEKNDLQKRIFDVVICCVSHCRPAVRAEMHWLMPFTVAIVQPYFDDSAGIEMMNVVPCPDTDSTVISPW